jgi:hypothetical protein
MRLECKPLSPSRNQRKRRTFTIALIYPGFILPVECKSGICNLVNPPTTLYSPKYLRKSCTEPVPCYTGGRKNCVFRPFFTLPRDSWHKLDFLKPLLPLCHSTFDVGFHSTLVSTDSNFINYHEIAHPTSPNYSSTLQEDRSAQEFLIYLATTSDRAVR